MSEQGVRAALEPPFWGPQLWEPPMEEVHDHLERMSLLVGRWGFKKGNLSEGEYRRILEGEAQGHYERIRAENLERKLFVPRAAVAWLKAKPEGDRLWVFPHEGGEPVGLDFPRQQIRERLCIPDFFVEGGDAAGFLTVTVGNEGAARWMEELQDEGRYQEYFFWNGYAAEYADAVAEWTHRKMLEFLGGKQGARFGPGYPSCPDTTLSRWIWRWTRAERIGVELTDSNMLVPEMSTCALVAAQPWARVFNVMA